MNELIFYDYAAAACGSIQPEFVKYDDAATRYYARYLLKRAMSVFTFTLPENWDPKFFKYCLFELGRVGVIKSSYGVIPVICNLSGFNLYYGPANILVQNPNLPSKENGKYRIGKAKLQLAPQTQREAGLILLQPDYTGALSTCFETAQKLALIQQAVIMNLQNSKLAYAFMTNNKATAETFKAIYDEIQGGSPAVVVGKEMLDDKGNKTWDTFTNDLKQNYIVSSLLDDARKTLNDFCTLWGIPSTNYGKKERMTIDEVNANNVETETLVDVCLKTLQDSIKQVNELFAAEMQGTLSVRKTYTEREENAYVSA